MASSLVMIRVRSMVTPGTLRGFEPVATMISAAATQRGRALDPVDLVLLEQVLDALGQAADDLVLARLNLAHVDGRGAEGQHHAPFVGVLDHLERVRVFEEGLGWNAAPQQAGAPERGLPLHHGHALAQLRGPDGGHVAARPRADDDGIVFLGHRRFS